MVFSSWGRLLRLVGEALAANGVEHASLCGASLQQRQVGRAWAVGCLLAMHALASLCFTARCRAMALATETLCNMAKEGMEVHS